MDKQKLLKSCPVVLIALCCSQGIQAVTKNTNNADRPGITNVNMVVDSLATKPVSAVWTLHQGATNSTSAGVSDSITFSTTDFELGSNIQVNSTEPVRTMDGIYTEYQPIVSNSGAKVPGSNDYIKIKVTPKKGIHFTPTGISFKAAKMGTSGGTLEVRYYNEGGDTTTVATALNPARNNSHTTYNIDTLKAESSTKSLNVLIYIYNLANTKALALDSLTINGTYWGTPVYVPSYKLTTAISDPAAGSITISPYDSVFDKGTNIKLTAKENFSYHFQNWIDKNGNVISTENPFSFDLTCDTALTAVYKKNNIHSFKISYTNGAISNLVTVSPKGTNIDGTIYYEEGISVKLNAQNNYILTFTNWEDNSTSMERIITMNKDQNITANFSARDYIVGWDMMQDQPNSQRAADYKSDTENAGLLSIRKSDGSTSSWLAHGYSGGLYNGKYCAINWKTMTDNYYYEISFSGKGYSSIKVKAALGCSYNSYSSYDWQYSTDNINYMAFGRDTIVASGWVSNEFALPDFLNGKDKIYVRFMPDYSSTVIGSSSTVDGLGLTDIFVTADKENVYDPIAPKLVSSIPASGSTDASATGSIVMTFDKKLIKGTGDATLDGEILKGTFSGKTVVFSYNGLKYSTEYTFHLPSGYILNKDSIAYEGCDITFKTMERTQPAARLYDAVVAQDGAGDYSTVQAAIDAAPAGRTTPYLIFIKAGTYKEHVDIPATKPYLHLIGQGYDKVFITDNKLCGGDNALSVDVGATVVDHASNGYFEGVSFVNSWGKEQNAGPQALALYTMDDRIVLNKCGLYSYQDTYLTTKTCNYRHYVKDCFIEGAVDFIYGQGNVYFDHCTLNIVRTSGGYIVAPNHAAATTWGYVFMNTTITAPGTPSETSIWLGRPWHDSPKTVYINTIAKVTIPAAGWYQTMSGIPTIWADYNTMDANGNPIDLSMRNNYYYYVDDNGDTIRGYAKNHLTDEEAASYTIKNVLSGNDAWQPTVLTEACEKPVVKTTDNKLSWEAVPYAICYVITKNDEVIGFTSDTSYDYDNNFSYKVQAVDEYGGLSDAGIVNIPTEILSTVSNDKWLKDIYTIDGRHQSTIKKGINILKYQDANGKTTIEKIIKK
jgi:pectin methylesterase-like acyl-CoA thioesterase